jgi:hypothetical protein
MLRSFLITIALFTFSVSFAQLPAKQTKFHRAYPLNNTRTGNDPDTSMVMIEGIQAKDGAYLVLSGMEAKGNPNFSQFVISQFNVKGEPKWSKKISLPGVEFLKGSSVLLQAKNDSIYFTMATSTGSKRQLLASLGADGSSLKIRNYVSLLEEESTPLFSSLIANSRKDTTLRYMVFSKTKINGVGDKFTNDFIAFNKDLSQINSKRILIQSGSASNDVKARFLNLKPYFKGSVASGTVQLSNDAIEKGLLSAFNLNDSVVWSKRYFPQSNISAGATFKFIEVESVGRELIVLGQVSGDPAYNPIVVARLDSIGRPAWVKTFNSAISANTFANGMVVRGDNITISGVMEFGGAKIMKPFAVNLKSDGTQLWAQGYQRGLGISSEFGDIISSVDGGSVIFVSDVLRDMKRPTIIKIDDSGKSDCETPIIENLFVDQSFIIDSLISKTEVINSNFTQVSGRNEDVNLFNLPRFSLNVRPFCPNEQIDWTFNAKTAGAIKWLWSDKSTADTLRVFKEGKYDVMVTMDTIYCYTICDTASLAKTMLPMVQIASGPQVCTGTDFMVFAQQKADSPVTWNWSNGSTNPGSITTRPLGTYAVSVTDKCGDVATANINITSSIYFPAPGGSIRPQNTVCRNAPFTLIANGEAGGGAPYTYKWNNNATTQNITVTALGSYTVTVTDKCGLTGSITLNVGENIYFPNPSGAIALGPQVCKNANFLLSGAAAGGGGSPYAIKWSTGEVTPTINKNTLGNYGITVTDNCAQTGAANINVTDKIFFEGPSAKIEKAKDDDFCNTGNVGLEAVVNAPSGGSSKYAWSNGNTTQKALVTENGSYTVTVTDVCQLTNTANVNVDYISKSPNCLKFPSIFMPGRSTVTFKENEFFGGINQCGENTIYEGYELKVFDRWGKMVFESSDVKDQWNGTNSSGDPNAADIYVWYSKYKIGKFCETINKGDINLFR